MAVGVVDGFEAVEVEEDDGQSLVVALGLRQRLLQAVGQQDAVGQGGQVVVVGDAFQLDLLVAERLAQGLALEQVADPQARALDLDRFGDVVRCPQGQAGRLGLQSRHGADEYDRNVAQRRIGTQAPADFVAVHVRHHDVEQDQVGRSLGRQRQAHRARGCDLHGEVRRQRGREHLQIGRCVVDGQDSGPGFWLWHCLIVALGLAGGGQKVMVIVMLSV